MKLRPNISRARERGVSLIECLVYIAVFAILLNGAGAAFYFCWDHTRAVIYAGDEIQSALRAGENWRADVRAATEQISIETHGTNEIVRIPEGQNEIVYRFESGKLSREIPAAQISRPLLARVKSSQTRPDPRGEIAAWRWELEVTPRLNKDTQTPLRFTFEAVAKNTP
ncbi:MAG TPA: prepilin-type N-terminal cleavage/methylation domain-containing protein [Verrucomicrobiae bacterium]|nr:prepilin-type N-terminal cleavage/methylation domain-containing protein [Verrucomicrobiae bacterium]